MRWDYELRVVCGHASRAVIWAHPNASVVCYNNTAPWDFCDAIMYYARSEDNSKTQDLSKGERLRNVFIVFGVIAAMIVVSHIWYAS